MTRFAPIVSFLSVIAVLVVLLLVRPVSQDQDSSEAYALPSLPLTPYASKQVWHQDSLQGKVTLLNFFASWCMPCAAEMPGLASLAKKYPSLHLTGVVWNDDPKAIAAFLKDHGNPFRSVWIDPTGDATIALGIRGIPESFLIDASGKVRFRLKGPLMPESRVALETMIAQLLEEASHAP